MKTVLEMITNFYDMMLENPKFYETILSIDWNSVLEEDSAASNILSELKFAARQLGHIENEDDIHKKTEQLKNEIHIFNTRISNNLANELARALLRHPNKGKLKKIDTLEIAGKLHKMIKGLQSNV